MPPKRPAPAGVSDYELQRQANIAKNKALFRELQLDAAQAGLAPNKSSRASNGAASSKPRSHKKATTRVKQETILPTRTSSRLKGIVADSEVAKRKQEEENERLMEAERAKRQRVAGDMKLDDIVVAGESWNRSGNWLRDVRPANPYERTFDEEDVKATTSKELRELREKMSGLELWEGVEPARIKITPERIYAMGFHPTEDKALVFAGDKLGNLGLFDASQKIVKQEADDEDEDELNSYEPPQVTTFKPHTRTISSIHFTPSQPTSLYTSSYDSSIRKLDLEKGTSVEVYGPRDLDADDPISGVSIPVAEPHLLYFASLHGTFGMHDVRTDQRNRVSEIMALSEKKIGGFSIHPTQPHLLATASLDRTLKVWDLRQISGRAGVRMPALVGEHESKLSVSHAAFNAAGQIATSSYDDTIKIHNLPSTITAAPPGTTHPLDPPSYVVPHNNQTGRWVTILRPHWQTSPTPVGNFSQRFCIGNMNRFVDIYSGTGEQLAQLGGDGITAVPAVAVFHASRDWVAGGTASGKLALWM